MTVLSHIEKLSDPDPFPNGASVHHLIHQSGCPLHVWWAAGRRCNRDGEHWQSWFVYLEYRQDDGRSAYVQREYSLLQVQNPEIWQLLAQVELPRACVQRSRNNLIGRC
ncbi:MAG: hypothetical protein V7707_07765 [Motiliproteus sp.]